MRTPLQSLSRSVTLAALAFAVAGCQTKARDEFVEIAPNETAFLVALDGDTLAHQEKLGSVDYLERNKVQAKRIIIPHKMLNICPSCLVPDLRDVATAKLIKINRSPVTREWTSTKDTGTSHSIDAFAVETSESIDFKIGGTLTAHVAEDDAAKFLYSYAGKQLEEVADGNVRSFVAASLARQFGSNTLDWGRTHKSEVFDTALKGAREFFAPRGISIDTLGFTEGMTYTDGNIQRAINKKFEADVAVEAARQQLAAAETLNKAQGAVLMQQELEMRKKMVDAFVTLAAKWDGHSMPQVIGMDPRQLLLSIGAEKPAR